MESKPKPHVEIYTDGGASPNPGAGGWGVLLISGEHRKELKGGEAETTNNRMELTAACEGLEALKSDCIIDFYTDSKYVKDGIQSWMTKWKQNGWKTAKRDPVKNQDLWIRLDAAIQRHDINWHWVKGHAGHEHNERVDELATEGRRPYERG
jgi:ribonuclease HI